MRAAAWPGRTPLSAVRSRRPLPRIRILGKYTLAPDVSSRGRLLTHAWH